MRAIYKNPSSFWSYPDIIALNPVSTERCSTVELSGPNSGTVAIKYAMIHQESQL